MEPTQIAPELIRRLRRDHPPSEVTQRRLQLLAEQWQPAGGGANPVVPMRKAAEEPPLPAAQASSRAVWRLDRRAWRALLIVLAAAAVIPAWAWWQGRPLPVTTIESTPAGVTATPFDDGSWTAATPSTVVVHVIGAVRKPGLVRLSAGARVDDAIAAAGGAKSAKALATVNLARLVVDGEQIIVGANQGAQLGTAGVSQGAAGTAGNLVSINGASAAQLEELPGVGPVLAQRIVEWRQSNGPFRSVEELGEVSGIGASILEQLRAKVTL